MEYFCYCQGTDSTAKTLKMPFIIVHSDLAVASLRLSDTGSHANCARLLSLEAEKMSAVTRQSCGISE